MKSYLTFHELKIFCRKWLEWFMPETDRGENWMLRWTATFSHMNKWATVQHQFSQASMHWSKYKKVNNSFIGEIYKLHWQTNGLKNIFCKSYIPKMRLLVQNCEDSFFYKNRHEITKYRPISKIMVIYNFPDFAVSKNGMDFEVKRGEGVKIIKIMST